MLFQQDQPLFLHLENDIHLLLQVLLVFILNAFVVAYPLLVHGHLLLKGAKFLSQIA